MAELDLETITSGGAFRLAIGVLPRSVLSDGYCNGPQIYMTSHSSTGPGTIRNKGWGIGREIDLILLNQEGARARSFFFRCAHS